MGFKGLRHSDFMFSVKETHAMGMLMDGEIYDFIGSYCWVDREGGSNY